MSVRILIGDCRERLLELPDGSVDSCVCDPPYHLLSTVKRFGKVPRTESTMPKSEPHARLSRGFMGQTWDGGDVAFDPATWAEVLRVLKPGAFLAAFGGTRTFHRLVCAIEDAGFEIRDTLSWNYGSGFPKSHNISKALEALPACSCGVGAEITNDDSGIIDAASPLRFGGAAVAAERAPVLPARRPTDTAERLGLEPSAEAFGRQPVVQISVENGVGHLDPVVLGPLDVTRIAEGEQIALGVGGGQLDPESLRDKVVDDEGACCATIGTAPVSRNDGGRNSRPGAPLVAPTLAAPCGVAAALHAPSVVGGHTRAGAVGPGPSTSEPVGLEVGGAGSAGEHRHTAERSTSGFKCEACGGVIRENIPQGLGTALKPAMELICLARKPIAEKNIAANVLAHGTGALNIDGCRIEHQTINGGNLADNPHLRGTKLRAAPVATAFGRKGDETPLTDQLGRWPANIIHDGSDEVLAGFPTEAGGNGNTSIARGKFNGLAEGIEPAFYGDTGSAARFFYCAKADGSERHDGCHDLDKGNSHPTVKPVDLMRWLVRLVTPKGGTVLDPFAGSGSTLIAADAEQFDAIGCELSSDYAAIAERRVRAAAGMFAEVQAA